MIRVGLVGLGMAGRVFHGPLLSSVEGLELAAVMERSTNKAAERYPGITLYRSLEAMLADKSLGLFVIATPNGTHYALTKEILSAGKNVVVDKPMALTSAEAAELIGLARKYKVLLAPFHNRRWDSDFLTVQKLLHEGTLGRLVAFESRFDRWRPARMTERLWKEDVDSGGMLQDLGPHLVDQPLALFGKPEGVSAEVLRERDGAGPNDSFTIRLRYPGLIVTVASNLLSLKAGPRYRLRGTRGGYVKKGVDPQEAALTKITRIDRCCMGPGTLVGVGPVVCGHRRRLGQPSRSGSHRRLPALLRGHSRCAAGQGSRSGHRPGWLARGAAARMGRGKLRKTP